MHIREAQLMISRTSACFICIFLGTTLASCGKAAPDAAQADLERKVDDVARKTDELRALLLELKQRPAADAELRAWLDRNLIPGQTTLGEVRGLFKLDNFDLDRPERDDILTVQVPLDDV